MPGSVAAQVASWGQRWPKQNMGPLGPGLLSQSGVSPNTFGDGNTQLGITVELFINGSWTDISTYVLFESKIRIARGKGRESTDSSPAQCTLTLKNPDKRFSPRNVNGPYFGYLGRNVKIRVSVNPGSNVYRQFTGRVSEWPQKIVTGEARFVSITASGQLRRLQQGNSPIKSALERATSMASPIALWRMNDIAASPTRLAEALGGGTDMSAVDTVISTTTQGPDGAPDQFPELMQIDDVTRIAFQAQVTARSGGSWTLDFIAKGSSGTTALTPIVPLTWHSGGMNWTIQMTSSGTQVIVTGSPRSNIEGIYGATISMTANISVAQDWHHYRITASQSGANLTTNLYVDFAPGFVADATDTEAGVAGEVLDFTVNMQTANADTQSASMGYLTLYAGLTGSDDTGSATDGWADELATARFARLCTEEGIDYVVVQQLPEDFSLGQYMGPQTTATLLANLQECRDAVEGTLDEDLDDNLRLTTRSAWYDQAAMLVLDYNVQLFNVDEFDPTDDDTLTRNDWTITRSGSSNPQRYELTTGPMNVSEPEDDPEGVGRYDDSATLNLSSTGGDDNALNHAGYRVAKGTVDKIRFSSLPLRLERDSGFITPWMSTDPLGGRVLVLNSPDDIGGGTQDQDIIGYEVTFDQFMYHIIMTTTPDDINKTGTLNFIGYLDSAGTTTNAVLDTTQTNVDVAISTNASWVHTTGDYNIMVDGEVMTVTAVGAVTGGPYPAVQFQTLTVTRSVNGVVKTHTTGKHVHVYDPFRTIL